MISGELSVELWLELSTGCSGCRREGESTLPASGVPNRARRRDEIFSISPPSVPTWSFSVGSYSQKRTLACLWVCIAPVHSTHLIVTSSALFVLPILAQSLHPP